jgi:cyclohexadienyl dehydratase
MRTGGCGIGGVAIALVSFAFAAAAFADTPTPAVLRVGASGDYKPFSFRDTAGAFTGFDSVVAQRLATDLGRTIEFVPFHWPDLASQLASGALDIAMSGVTVRADRALQMAFSRPYVITGAVVVIRANDHKKFADVARLDRKGVRVAVNRGGHLEQVARQHFGHADVVSVNDNATLPDLLLHGGADAVVSEELEARTWPQERIAFLGPFTRDRKAYAVRRDAPDLLRQVNDWLAARDADGWLNEQRRRWLGERATMTTQQAGFEALVAAMDLRLQLMPLVAAVKRREQLPIEDPAQEMRVLEHVRSTAVQKGLNPDDTAEVFRLLMAAARAIELSADTASTPSDLQLTDLRSALMAVSDEIITELARCNSQLADPGSRDQLDSTMRNGLSTSGLSPAMVDQLTAAVRHVRRVGS